MERYMVTLGSGVRWVDELDEDTLDDIRAWRSEAMNPRWRFASVTDTHGSEDVDDWSEVEV